MNRIIRSVSPIALAAGWGMLDIGSFVRSAGETERGEKRPQTLQSQLKRDARHSLPAQHTQRAAMMRRSQRGR